jgi:hypothetical protein
MPQVVPLRQGDAKTIRLVVRTTTMEYLNLAGYSAQLDLYTDPTNAATLIETWSTATPAEAVIVDPVNGQVEFYITVAQTTALNLQQYVMRARLIKDADHIYTVYEGILNIRS